MFPFFPLSLAITFPARNGTAGEPVGHRPIITPGHDPVGSPGVQYRIVVLGSPDVLIGWGETAAAAEAMIAGPGWSGLFVRANTTSIFTLPMNSFIAGRTTTANTTVNLSVMAGIGGQ